MSFVRRAGMWFVLLAAISVALTHICVPHDASANPATHAPADAHHGDDEGDAMHGASCEGLRSSPARLMTVAASPPVTESAVEPVIVHLTHRPEVVVRGPSPPLYLLHAALLI